MSEEPMGLFDTVKVREWTLRNRLVMPPMVSVRDIASREGVEWYAEHARGGPGLVIIEATSIWRFDRDLSAASLKPVVDAIHAGGARAAIQLFPIDIGSKRDVDSLSTDEIAGIAAQFAKAARICRDAGMDGVEPHGAHGYLLNRFFSAVHNERKDKYGGSLRNRMRFGLEIVEAMHQAVADELMLLYRHTPVMEDSYGMSESLEFARHLVAAGVDVLDISPSSEEAPADRAAPFRELGVPVIGVGAMDVPGRAAEALAHRRADLIAVGRGLIADPDWPRKVQADKWESITTCTKCNELCFGNLKKGRPIACTQW